MGGRMTTDVPLRCACGSLRGSALGLSPKAGFHVVCYCRDCQAFARFLHRPDITDAWGGTDIFQTAPSRVRISSGASALSCMRLSPKGMHRWYCGDCKTPVGNTLGARMPFVGLIHSFIDYESAGRTPDEVLGSPVIYGFPEAAIGGPPAHARENRQLKYVTSVILSFGKWWVTGAGKPSPFFDEKTGAPRATVRVLSPEERAAL
jgi:hypothetical protein